MTTDFIFCDVYRDAKHILKYNGLTVVWVNYLKLLLCLRVCQSHRQVQQVQEVPVKFKQRN